MDKKKSQKQFLDKIIRLLSSPGGIPSLRENGLLFEPEVPALWRLILWLEIFLNTKEMPSKEEWGLLSTEEKDLMGIELLKCYLFRPLFLELCLEKKPTRDIPHFITRQGKILKAEYGDGPNRTVRFFYPLAHRLLWPGMLVFLNAPLFSIKEGVPKIHAVMTVLSSFCLKESKDRAEFLKSLILPSPEGRQKESLVTQPEPPVSTPPQKMKKGKTSKGQMTLFD
jgi:hypothetical protein